MRTDQNVASGDSTLAALMRQGVTVAHIVLLLQEAFPKHWQQHLRNHLGATRPTDLTPAELAEFTDHVLLAAGQAAGMGDPAAVLVLRAQLDAKEATAKLMAPAEMANIAAEQKTAQQRRPPNNTPDPHLLPPPTPKTPSADESMTVACSAIATKETSSSEDCPRGRGRNGCGTIRSAGKLVRNSYAICRLVPGLTSRLNHRSALDEVDK